MNTKKQSLGRGLSALLGNEEYNITAQYSKNVNIDATGSIANLRLDQIEANPFQPRTEFDEETLQELADSIKKIGIVQPVTVRKLNTNKYQLISGERRFKASKLAGLEEIPAYIRIANDQSMLEMALVENIQRENLDAVEIALSYNRLIDECKLTQEELSERVGKKRSTITNYLRLLKLPPEIQLGLRKNKISMGHARTLINVENPETQLAIFYDILENELSVRQVETITKDIKDKITDSEDVKGTKRKVTVMPLPESYIEIKNQLTEHLKTNVDIKNNTKGYGNIVIPFSSEEDLQRILSLLKG